MSKTGLAFHRKNQSLVDLEKERPKSIAAVRQALRQAVDHVTTKLSHIEREFYGGRTCDGDIRAIRRHVKVVMATFEVTYIHGAYQIREIINRYNDPTETLKVNPNDVTKVVEYHRKILQFVPSKFDDVIHDIEEIVGYLEKYLLSYLPNGRRDEYLETANHYQSKRVELKDAILSHLRNISYMSKMYYDRGTPVNVFGFTVNETARRCDCGDLPFLLLFPQCCQNINNAIQGIFQWLKADDLYAAFLECDILGLEEKRQKQEVRMRDAEEAYVVSAHKLKQTKREIADLLEELDKLSKREKENVREVCRLEEAIRTMQLDIEMREDERTSIKFILAKSPDMDYSKQLEKIAAHISELRYKIPATNKEIQQVKGKISFISEKRATLQEKRELVVHLKTEVLGLKSDARSQVAEHKRIVDCLELLKYIHLQKTSPASTKNIFHQMPPRVRLEPHRRGAPGPEAQRGGPREGRSEVKAPRPRSGALAQRARGTKRRRDDVEKVASVVAKHIGSDWPTLYRALPFYPPRGDKTLDSDVIEITTVRLRSGNNIRARDSLVKWRRMHTRANVDDLRKTLQSINRRDVIEQIDESAKAACNRQCKAKVAQRWRKLKTFNMVTSRFVLPKINGLKSQNNRTVSLKGFASNLRQLKLPSVMVSGAE